MEDLAKILVCDDDKAIVDVLCIYLQQAGYAFRKTYTGKQALQALEEERFDLVLLDIMMPELDGISTLQRLRDRYNMPVIMLSAKSESSDKIQGLSHGADDYVTKPFTAGELLARIRSQLRRYTKLGAKPEGAQIYSSGALVLDDAKKTVFVEDQEVNLTGSEFNILKFLLQNKNKVHSSAEIYSAVWQTEACGGENVVAVHIHNIREKIEINPKDPRYLILLWGKGYYLKDWDKESAR